MALRLPGTPPASSWAQRPMQLLSSLLICATGPWRGDFPLRVAGVSLSSRRCGARLIPSSRWSGEPRTQIWQLAQGRESSSS